MGVVPYVGAPTGATGGTFVVVVVVVVVVVGPTAAFLVFINKPAIRDKSIKNRVITAKQNPALRPHPHL
jgi:hypothetical protein